MDVWQWFTGSVSLESMLQALGLGVLAWLFATDRIITKGQHLRRVADIVTAHGLLIAAKDETRAYYQQAHAEERTRADAATERLAESVEVTKAALQALQALDEAAAGRPR